MIDYISGVVFSYVTWIPEFKTEIENLNKVTKRLLILRNCFKRKGEEELNIFILAERQQSRDMSL